MQVMEKVLKINPNPQQLQVVIDYQNKCLEKINVALVKTESDSGAVNDALAFALEKTKNRLVLDNQIITKIQKSFDSKNGVALTEDIMGFLFASKMMYQQEQNGWATYKVALEKQTLEDQKPSGGFDFSWVLLIIILIIAGSRAFRIYQAKKNPNLTEK